jgi:hypothetical protein
MPPGFVQIMEPEDFLPPPGAEPAAGSDELRSIVSRADRRRLRVLAGGVAVALAAGAGVGYAVSQIGSHPRSQTIVAGSSGSQAPAINSDNSAPSPPSSSGGASGSTGGGAAYEQGGTGSGVVSPVGPATYKRIFTRQVGNVDVRGFTVSFHPAPNLPPETVCGAVFDLPRFQSEVSTPGMVGMATPTGLYQPAAPSGKLSSVSGQVLGVQEGDPVVVVTANAGAGVSKVRMAFAATRTTDTMTPVDGWVTLVAEAPASAQPAVNNLGTLQALTSTGAVVDTVTVQYGMIGAIPPAVPGCVCPGPAMGAASSSAAPGSMVFACAVHPTPAGAPTLVPGRSGAAGSGQPIVPQTAPAIAPGNARG